MRLPTQLVPVATLRPRRRSRGVAARLERGLGFLLSLLAALAPVAGAAPRRTLPQPAASLSWPLWEHYAQSAIDGQGRVIDHSAQDHTTSEGQAYAMFFALVANDRLRFDQILGWTQTNLAQGDLATHLPAWLWGHASDGSWKTLDPNAASDADLWMAYDLMEAGRLWHEPRYDTLGRALAANIAHKETASVPGLGTVLLSAPAGLHVGGNWLLNPSYMPPQLLAYFAAADPAGPWAAILHSLEPLLGQSSPGGFAMDWVLAGQPNMTGQPGPVVRPGPTPAQFAAGDMMGTPAGSYDAIRVYLWLGLADRETPGVKELLSHLSGMAGYMAHHAVPPQRVDGSGKVVDANAPVGFSAALAPYLAAVGMKTQAGDQWSRMAALLNPATGLYGRDGLYYDQNLALFGSGWNEQRLRFDRDGRLRVRWR